MGYLGKEECMSDKVMPICDEIYFSSLAAIETIKFSRREIDVMGCLFKGRTTKKIALILSVSPKTVATHLRNIMLKLNVASKEGILDFIESTNKIAIFQAYYNAFLLSLNFERILSQIAKRTYPSNLTCTLVFWKNIEHQNYYIHLLKSHLNAIGVHINLDERNESDEFSGIQETSTPYCCLYVVFSNDEKIEKLGCQLQQAEIPHLFLVFDREAPKNYLKEKEHLSLLERGNYYFLFLELVKRLFPMADLNDLIINFKKNCDKNHSPSTMKEGRASKKLPLTSVVVRYKKKISLFLIALLILGVAPLAYIIFKSVYLHNPTILPGVTIRSDIPLPSAEILLERSALLAQLKDKFKMQAGIQTVALVGMGGAGKTTLARQFARETSSLVWEVNAENYNNLTESFEKLAYVLGRTDLDKKLLAGIQSIKESDKKEQRILFFVKEKLKSCDGWLLIFDNVVKFSDIATYFPHDPAVWGRGKVILTTRDANIQHNKYIGDALFVGELDKSHTLSLFSKIITQGKKTSFTPTQESEIVAFLDQLPPFPLDISTAAYYVKATGISYQEYIEKLHLLNKNFLDFQKNISYEFGGNAQTRHKIIALSVDLLVKTHKDFSALLLLVSLLDSQTIPRDLLNKHTDPDIVDMFLYNVKKYSLLTVESKSIAQDTTVSIHRNIQHVSLACLKEKLNLDRNEALIIKISESLENYVNDVIDSENFTKLKVLANHCEIFLKHESLLSSRTKGILESCLGKIYFYLFNYAKAKQELTKALSLLKGDPHTNSLEIARTLAYLGIVYRELGDQKKALECLQNSLIIYQKDHPLKRIELAKTLTFLGFTHRVQGGYRQAESVLKKSLDIYRHSSPECVGDVVDTLVHLGVVYKESGRYKKAKEYLEEGELLYKKHKKTHHNLMRFGHVYGNLGRIYMSYGDYGKAKAVLENALIVHERDLPPEHTDISWILTNLGITYNELGEYAKAKNALERALKIDQKNYGLNNAETSWSFFALGNLYANLGHYDKAQNIIKQHIAFCAQQYGKSHIHFATSLRKLGDVYLLEGNTEKAEDLVKRSMGIYIKNNQPLHKGFESLGKIYLKKSEKCLQKGEKNDALAHRQCAKGFFSQSLNILKSHYPKDSPDVGRIQALIQASH